VRIAHITSELCRSSAGLGAAVAGISATTKVTGNEVRVFGLSSPGWKAGDSAVWSGANAEVFEKVPWSGPFGYAPGLLPALMAFDPDIVHLHGLWTYPSVAAHAWHRATGRPYVVSAHGMLYPVSLAYKPLRKTIARWLFQNRVLHSATVLHATSTDEEVNYRSLGFDARVVLIPLGLETIPMPMIDREGPSHRVLFLGRLHHQKGLDWLIEAWAKLENGFPDWELSIVGPLDRSFVHGMEEIRLKASGKRVTFLEPLYGDNKNRYMANSDLFVMPSRSENFGLTAAESLMMEVPVIATKGAPWSGLAANNAGWWIEPGSAALETAMRAAMSLPVQERRKMGQNGRQWMQQDFSWAAIGNKWQEVYEVAAKS
jgi:glycosyltransferase involved in cell wall biosynthesis